MVKVRSGPDTALAEAARGSGPGGTSRSRPGDAV